MYELHSKLECLFAQASEFVQVIIKTSLKENMPISRKLWIRNVLEYKPYSHTFVFTYIDIILENWEVCVVGCFYNPNLKYHAYMFPTLALLGYFTPFTMRKEPACSFSFEEQMAIF